MRVKGGREGLRSEKTASEVHRPGEEATAWLSAPRAARARVQVPAADSPETDTPRARQGALLASPVFSHRNRPAQERPRTDRQQG